MLKKWTCPGKVQPVDQFGQNGILSGGTHGYNHHTGPVFTLALQDGFQHGQRHVQIHVVFRGEQPEGYSAGKFSIVISPASFLSCGVEPASSDVDIPYVAIRRHHNYIGILAPFKASLSVRAAAQTCRNQGKHPGNFAYGNTVTKVSDAEHAVHGGNAACIGGQIRQLCHVVSDDHGYTVLFGPQNAARSIGAGSAHCVRD